MFEKEIESLISGNNRFRNKDWIEKNLSSLFSFVDIQENGTIWKEKLFCFLNKTIPSKCYCGNDLEFLSLSKGYREYCSKNCQVKSPSSKERRKLTCVERYGSDNPMKSDLVKEKYVNSIFDKYGVDNIGKLDSSKDKVKKTNMERYGVEYLSQLEIVRKSLSDRLKIRSRDMNFIKIESIKFNIIDKISEFDIEFIDIIDSSLYLMTHSGHEFEIHKTTLNDRIRNGNTICTVCNKIESGSDSEKKLLEFIKSIYNGETIENSRNTISSEIDIYLPDLKIAFEYNGVFWHSDRFKDKNYHLKKTSECQEIGIKLIHIWEDDWRYKNDIVRSRISNLLGKSNKIWARSCSIKEVSNSESKLFFERNHIQGYCVSKVRIGLYHKDVLVSLMSFGNLRKSLGFTPSGGNYELLRFCNDLNCSIVGGASKIFKYFVKRYNPLSIISYADRSWSNGELYRRLGFSFEKETSPNYYWVVNGVRKNRFNYRKDVLVREGFDPKMSEFEIMKSRGFNKTWDSGSLKFKIVF